MNAPPTPPAPGPVLRDAVALILSARDFHDPATCAASARVILGRDEPSEVDHVAQVAHLLAHMVAVGIPAEDWPELRVELRTLLAGIAAVEAVA